MNDMEKSFVRRRQHSRFRLSGGTVGIEKRNYVKMGQIMNISMGGLSFRYFNSGVGSCEFPDSSQMAILITQKGFHLEKISFDTVKDFEIKPKFMEMRQRCIEFKDLASFQKVHLKYLIERLTTGPFVDNRNTRDRRIPPTSKKMHPVFFKDKTDKIVDRRNGGERRAHYQ